MRVKPGALMAHVAEFKVTIQGKGGHGSQPQVAVDPVLVAAHVVVALQSIVSRSVHPSQQVGRCARASLCDGSRAPPRLRALRAKAPS